MKNNKSGVCLLAGRGNTTTNDLCQLLAKEGISAIVKQKETAAPAPDNLHENWSGKPGEDLFFNGWKLLF